MHTNPLPQLTNADAPRTRIAVASRFLVSVMLTTLGLLGCVTQRDNAPEAGEVRNAASRQPDVDGVAPAPAPVPAQFSSGASSSSDVPQGYDPAQRGDAGAGGLTAEWASSSNPVVPVEQPPQGSLLIPGRVEAERFARFNETDAPMDASECGDGRVDMGLTDDADGECYVGWTQGGEWLEYDVWASDSNVYSLVLRLASGDAGREVAVLVDGDEVGRVLAPGQGWAEFHDVVLEDVAIPAGEHAVRIAFVSGQTNFNFMLFEGSVAPPPNPPASGTSPTPNSSAHEVDQPVTGEGCAEAPDGYQLVWWDEFDYDGLPDGERWGYEVGGDGWGNGELQYYTEARLANAEVGGGVLTITAVPEVYEGNDYTSAKLNSSYGASNPGSWNEGIVRIRARLPAGLGTWPALWMMPDNCTEGWPACGEIDVMEHVGYDEGTVHGTIHTDAFNHVEGTQRGQSVRVADATAAFHEYALVWQSDRLQWLVDGEVYFTIEKEESWGFAEWPFSDKTWHLKMNLAVGGAWGGAEGVNRDDFPTGFQIDYVCVYQPVR